MYFFYIFIFFISVNIFAVDKIDVQIAVSSNFLPVINLIIKEFKSKCNITVSSDATSILYNKIVRGAPFDIFISADSYHPILLETKNNKSHFYCYGKLVLFFPKFMFVKNIFRKFNETKYFIIANTQLSPYGYSSMAVFNNLRFFYYDIVYGLNITHTFNLIRNNYECIGFIALSQVIKSHEYSTKYWKIPQYLYNIIEQRFIVLQNANNNCLFEFLSYFLSENIKNIIISYGYKIK